jgi:DNA-binding MarR family transcriptional regulator
MKRAAHETDRLSELMFEMGRLLKHQMSVDGYGPSFYLHLETLRFIAERESVDMREVAVYLRISAPSATGLIDALARQKLVERSADKNDRRRVCVKLTKKGMSTIEKAKTHRAEAFARVTKPLSPKDRAELIRILTIITSHK